MGNKAGVVGRGGVTFFWVLNDDCNRASLSEQLDDFQKAEVEALVLHPRAGLLLPYGSSDWFELVQWLADECLRRGIEPILYDEDPYPSGNAGGRVVADYPEFAGAAIERFAAPDSLKEGDLFLFPQGRLCWAGIVFPEEPAQPPVDLSTTVGMIRRHWEKSEWDSRWYYPATPVYSCPRSFAIYAEFALRCPQIPKGGKLVAFVARTVHKGSEWGTLADTLNPEATRHFIRCTHESYAASLNGRLGRSVRAIFTDEAKPHSPHAWTPGLFESFETRYGYDLRPHLESLFTTGASPEAMRVRLDYREWVIRRFDESWARPLAEWSEKHGLALIGHFSPEEDPVSQSAMVGNLFPLQKRLTLPGFDLIVPAIGDRGHALLNIAAIASVSAAQQNGQSGVCCESLGAFGTDVTASKVARVLAWQALHGVNLAVIHGIFSSSLGLRRYEAPPDYGPRSDFWGPMTQIRRDLEPLLRSTLGKVQEAPVAILWPIRSFQALGAIWESENSGMRKDLMDLLFDCLSSQIGVHLIDEDGLVNGNLRGNKLLIGKAAYQWILIPSVKVIGMAAFERLKTLERGGIRIAGVGEPLQWVWSQGSPLLCVHKPQWPQFRMDEFRIMITGLLPRLAEIRGEGSEELQVTAWRSGSQRELLAMNLGRKRRILEIDGQPVTFSPGELSRFILKGGKWSVEAKFNPVNYRDRRKKEAKARFGIWKIRLPDGRERRSSRPLAAYQLVSVHEGESVHTILGGKMGLGEAVVAPSVTYEVEVTFPPGTKRAILRVEPTLMRGSFTLKAGAKKWRFAVDDVDIASKSIDLSRVAKSGRVVLTFVLHRPKASDGIKCNPCIEVEIADGLKMR